VNAYWPDGSLRNDIEPPDPWLDGMADREAYLTEISVPSFADNDGWRLHASMLQPEPLPEPEAEAEAGP
jgi:hypothetical protein